jgi:hypothetical protein
LNVCVEEGIIVIGNKASMNPGDKILNSFINGSGGLSNSNESDERFTQDREKFQSFLNLEFDSGTRQVLKSLIKLFSVNPEKNTTKRPSSAPATTRAFSQRVRLCGPIETSNVFEEGGDIIGVQSEPRRLRVVHEREKQVQIKIVESLNTYQESWCGELKTYLVPNSNQQGLMISAGGRQVIVSSEHSAERFVSFSGPGNLSYQRDYAFCKDDAFQPSLKVPSSDVFSGVPDRWKFHYDPSGSSGIYCSATSAQTLLKEMFHAATNKVYVPIGDSKVLPCFIGKIRMGLLKKPSSKIRDPFPGSFSGEGVFPGFFTPLSSEQRNHLETTFDDMNPCCASGVSCLFRKEFAADPDPRLWREIHFCKGEKHHITDVVDLTDSRCKTFVQIYKGLEKIGFPHTWKHDSAQPALIETSCSFQLYSISLPDGSNGGECTSIGLAVMLHEDSTELFDSVMEKVQQKLFGLASVFYSDWYLPRVVRVFQSALMAPPSEFQRYGMSLSEQDVFSNDISDHSVFVYHSEKRCYQKLTSTALEDFDYATLWASSRPKGDLSFQIRLPCSMSDSDLESGPKMWYHAGCIDAENSTNEALTKHSSILGTNGITYHYKCPCCDDLMERTFLNQETGAFSEKSLCAGKTPRNMIEAFGQIEIPDFPSNYIFRCTMPTAITKPISKLTSETALGPEPIFSQIFGPQNKSDFFLQSRFLKK